MKIDRLSLRKSVDLLRRWQRRRSAPDVLVASERTVGSIYAGSASCSRLIYATKVSWIDFLMMADVDLSDIEVFARPGVLVSSYASLLRREAEAQKNPVLFIG